jgi:hypothetical protein
MKRWILQNWDESLRRWIDVYGTPFESLAWALSCHRERELADSWPRAYRIVRAW